MPEGSCLRAKKTKFISLEVASLLKGELHDLFEDFAVLMLLHLDFMCFGLDFSTGVFAHDGVMDQLELRDFKLAIFMILGIFFGHLFLLKVG